MENEQAFKYFEGRLNSLDQLEGYAKIKELIKGVLTGNIFDWGAKEIASLLETSSFSFEDAQRKIPGKATI